MAALDTLIDVCNSSLVDMRLKYCLVDRQKHPYKINNEPARVNKIEDFVDLESLTQCDNLGDYAGLGISIQASNICAIDIDSCFSNAFDVHSADNRAKMILEEFKDKAYCEFSFSGKGMRILFREQLIENYSDIYFIKNSTAKIEYYQPSSSFRYVTVTGKTIANGNNDIHETLCWFLNRYMIKPTTRKTNTTYHEETRRFEDLICEVKKLYFRDALFQNLWFAQAPGSGKNESELDYQLLALLYENITQDEIFLKQLFETSPYYLSKDAKHLYKWSALDNRYFKYMYGVLRRTK